MARVVFAAMFLLVVAFCGTEVLAQTHHVVGGDDAWLAGRVFRVGDKIWFRYPAAEDTIAELQSLEEFVSCDVTNPIRMYTDGLNDVTLEKEGTRFFTSGNVENCKNGMKLPVPVEPSTDESAPSTEPEPSPPIHPAPAPSLVPVPFVPPYASPPPYEPAPPTQPKPLPPIHPEPAPPLVPTPPEPVPVVPPSASPPPYGPAPPTQPKPLPPIHPEPAPPLVPTPPEPIPVLPPPASPPPPPSAAATLSNALSFAYYGLFLSYFVL